MDEKEMGMENAEAKQADDEARQESGLLEELIRIQKKQTKTLRAILIVFGVIAAVLLIAAVILVPKATHLMNSAEEAITEVETLTAEAQDSLKGIDEMVEGAQDMVDGAQGIVGSAQEMVTVARDKLEVGTEDIQDALKRLNSVDIETLNQAIRDLSDAVEPMAKFAQLFK